MPKEQVSEPEKQSSGKDAGIAALISIVGMLLLAAPSLGYVYLGNVRKGIIYLVVSWVLLGIVIGVALFGGTLLAIATSGLGACCIAPLPLIPLLFDIIVVYDVYITAKGEKPKLPF
ncbi:MAG: hypothetical protein PHV13_06015 [Candidatus ainarchaeum sp.]|nr:hypothetical protein [Candidatus ainarchaeum sp.]